MKLFLATLILNLLICFQAGAQKNADAIIGRWETIDNRLIIDVYKKNQDYKAKVVWFKDESNQVMNARLDEKNPNKALRNRRWIGMEVLKNLKYDPEENEWVDGIIYDAKHGREWDSIAWLNDDHLLKVKGYWVFKFMSQTLTFKKLHD